MSILLRLAIRYALLREGEITLDEALDDQIIDDFIAATGACQCARDIMANFDRIHDEMRRRGEGAWTKKPRPRETEPARSRLDGYGYLVRLNDPERLKAWLGDRPDLRAWLKWDQKKWASKK
jgi:hypothetical protein